MSTFAPGKDVEIEERFVLLELGPNEQTGKSKEYFVVGMWRWQLSVLRSEKETLVTLSPKHILNEVVVSVSLKLTYFPQSRPVVLHNLKEVDVPLKRPYTWTVMGGCESRCLVEIKFGVNYKVFGRTHYILRPTRMRTTSVEQAQSSVARMLREDILTDITINAVGGSIRAHRAVLAARSPVFLSMFTHDLREKELSTVDISDMSIDACQAFVGCLYGVATSEEELLVHRSELVVASDKYGVENLKKACEESMIVDVSTENLLERLQMAHTYSLPALKRTCVRLLVDFGRMYEIPNDFEEFMKTADQDIVGEIRSTAMLRGRKLEDRQKPSAEKTRRRKSTPSQDSDGGAPGKRVRRLNVRLAGDEWAK